MKTIFFSLYLCAPLWVAAQSVDSTAIRQADSLLQVAGALINTGAFGEVMNITTTVEKLALEKLGRESAAYGSCCHIRGVILYYQNNLNEAERWCLEAIEVRERALGKDHPDYANSLNLLALVYINLGQYEKAEPLLLESKSIQGKVLGREHPRYAMISANLASLYIDLGNYKEAEPIQLEVKNIFEKTLGKESFEYCATLDNLGLLYYNMDQYEKAESLYLEAKDIFEHRLNALTHPYYKNCLNNLALLYSQIGQYEKAEQFYFKTMNIQEKIWGKEHPNYTQSLHNLAILYYHIGQYEKAEPLLIEAMNTLEKTVGKEHPIYVLSPLSLALLYWKMGKYEQVAPYLIELDNLNRLFLTKASHYLSERELNSYLGDLNETMRARKLVLPFTQLTGSKSLPRVCYDNALFYKGFLLNAASRLNNLAESSPEARELNSQLKEYQRRLAAQYALPIVEREGVSELEEKANALEKELARTVAGYAEAVRQVNWTEVQAALKPNEAALEFVRFNYYNPSATDSVLYAALILRPGLAAPQYISLCEEKQLATLLRQGTEKQEERINGLYRNPALYTSLWQPLEQALSGVQTVYFSPDGLLHRFNLRAVATPGGSILADRYRLIRLNSTRQLVIPPSTKPAANDALVYGGIQYDMDAGAIKKANASLAKPSPSGTRGELDSHYADSTHRLGYRGPGEGGAWQYLPFTEVEAGLLQHDLQETGTSVRVLSGYAATEESFKSIGRPSPRILHFATHGFFFPDPKHPVDGRRWTVDGREPVFKMSDHPMIRSGLLLAGANYAWKSGQPLQPGMEDGILTAYEISQMNLAATELVVLSACETGLGDIAGNEGVYGLQRAFKIAGSHYLLMSLWKIPDLETQQLMTTFYRRWLKDGQSVPDAFRATQQEMREKYKDPYLWAGFVLVE